MIIRTTATSSRELPYHFFPFSIVLPSAHVYLPAKIWGKEKGKFWRRYSRCVNCGAFCFHRIHYSFGLLSCRPCRRRSMRREKVSSLFESVTAESELLMIY